MTRATEPKKLLAAAHSGDRAALARLLTLIESDPDLVLNPTPVAVPKAQSSPAVALAKAGPRPQAGCQVIGFTGSPGAGKSSLLDRLAGELSRGGAKPAILGIDPTSPFTGGAVLGDRVRISEETLAAGVFVRSMASRGSVGGLSRAVNAAVRLLSLCGYSPVMVETVGAGQGEVAVAELADTVVVVLVPGMGDDIQMLKMGILEIADVYAVNKADLGGSAAFVEHLGDALSGPGAHGRDRHEVSGGGAWRPAIVPTSARTGEGVRDLAAAIESHRQYLATGERGRVLRAARAGRRILRSLAERLAEEASCEGACGTELRRLAAAVAAGKMSEWRAAGELMRSTMPGPKNRPAGKSGRPARKR